MKYYGNYEAHSIYTTDLNLITRSVRVNVRDDWNGTYDYEESVLSMEQYLQKHSYSLNSILYRY